jgi:hypothetical protein
MHRAQRVGVMTALFPLIADEYSSFKADIEANGLHVRIRLAPIQLQG